MRNDTTIPLDIVGSSSFDRYKKQSLQQTWNMIISDDALVPYPGYKKVQNISSSDSRARALYISTKIDLMFVVIDDSLYSISNNLGVSNIGLLQTQSGFVVMTENNAGELTFCDGEFLYVYNYEAGGLTVVTDLPDGFRPIYVDFQDGYILVADGNSNLWYLSQLNQATIYKNPQTGLFNNGAFNNKADNLVATVSFNNQVFIMGRKATEIWHDVGLQGFPFQKDISLGISYGCSSPGSIAEGFGLLVWLASNDQGGPALMFSDGGAPKQISTDGINFLIGSISKPEQVDGFLFKENGHIFYQLTSPKDNLSLSYDFTTQKFFNISNECWDAHIAKRVGYFNNSHYFVSTLDSGLYEMSSDIPTYNATLSPDTAHVIPRARVTNSIRMQTSARYALNEITVTMAQGDYNTPQKVELSMSKDGAQSFGTKQVKELNKIGNRPNALNFHQLGSSNDTVFRFDFWGECPFVIIGAQLRYSQ